MKFARLMRLACGILISGMILMSCCKGTVRGGETGDVRVEPQKIQELMDMLRDCSAAYDACMEAR